MDKKISWWSWKAPIGLGIFLLTAALALAIFLYTVLNLVGTIQELSHPADSSQGMTAQEMQQLESQQAPATTGTTGSAMGE